jgi:hypothetical protein
MLRSTGTPAAVLRRQAWVQGSRAQSPASTRQHARAQRSPAVPLALLHGDARAQHSSEMPPALKHGHARAQRSPALPPALLRGHAKAQRSPGAPPAPLLGPAGVHGSRAAISVLPGKCAMVHRSPPVMQLVELRDPAMVRSSLGMPPALRCTPAERPQLPEMRFLLLRTHAGMQRSQATPIALPRMHARMRRSAAPPAALLITPATMRRSAAPPPALLITPATVPPSLGTAPARPCPHARRQISLEMHSPLFVYLFFSFSFICVLSFFVQIIFAVLLM